MVNPAAVPTPNAYKLFFHCCSDVGVGVGVATCCCFELRLIWFFIDDDTKLLRILFLLANDTDDDDNDTNGNRRIIIIIVIVINCLLRHVCVSKFFQLYAWGFVSERLIFCFLCAWIKKI